MGKRSRSGRSGGQEGFDRADLRRELSRAADGASAGGSETCACCCADFRACFRFIGRNGLAGCSCGRIGLPSGSLSCIRTADDPCGSTRSDAAASGRCSCGMRAAQEGILALQRLQEQTAQLHQQFLEGQESARRAIQSLLSLRSGVPAGASLGVPASVPMAVNEYSTATFAPAAAPVSRAYAPAPSAAQPARAPATAPVPTVVSQAVPAASRALYEKTVLDVVSDKTGYPVEMLTLDMGMDADLGIDSIKRVEIMAALRGKLPQAPEIKPEHLGSLQTLEQVVAFLAAGAGTDPAVLAAAPAVAVVPAASAEVRVSGTATRLRVSCPLVPVASGRPGPC